MVLIACALAELGSLAFWEIKVVDGDAVHVSFSLTGAKLTSACDESPHHPVSHPPLRATTIPLSTSDNEHTATATTRTANSTVKQHSADAASQWSRVHRSRSKPCFPTCT